MQCCKARGHILTHQHPGDGDSAEAELGLAPLVSCGPTSEVSVVLPEGES